jgi:hypothetical protein
MYDQRETAATRDRQVGRAPTRGSSRRARRRARAPTRARCRYCVRVLDDAVAEFCSEECERLHWSIVPTSA